MRRWTTTTSSSSRDQSQRHPLARFSFNAATLGNSNQEQEEEEQEDGQEQGEHIPLLPITSHPTAPEIPSQNKDEKNQKEDSRTFSLHLVQVVGATSDYQSTESVPVLGLLIKLNNKKDPTTDKELKSEGEQEEEEERDTVFHVPRSSVFRLLRRGDPSSEIRVSELSRSSPPVPLDHPPTTKLLHPIFTDKHRRHIPEVIREMEGALTDVMNQAIGSLTHDDNRVAPMQRNVHSEWIASSCRRILGVMPAGTLSYRESRGIRQIVDMHADLATNRDPQRMSYLYSRLYYVKSEDALKVVEVYQNPRRGQPDVDCATRHRVGVSASSSESTTTATTTGRRVRPIYVAQNDVPASTSSDPDIVEICPRIKMTAAFVDRHVSRLVKSNTSDDAWRDAITSTLTAHRHRCVERCTDALLKDSDSLIPHSHRERIVDRFIHSIVHTAIDRLLSSPRDEKTPADLPHIRRHLIDATNAHIHNAHAHASLTSPNTADPGDARARRQMWEVLRLAGAFIVERLRFENGFYSSEVLERVRSSVVDAARAQASIEALRAVRGSSCDRNATNDARTTVTRVDETSLPKSWRALVSLT